MGASVTIELSKPTDASDVRNTGDLDFARSEIIRLRQQLGHLAKDYGMDIVALDASDLVQGENTDEDFERCIREIAHIRRCLQLNTQTSKRRQRNYDTHTSATNDDAAADSKYDESEAVSSDDDDDESK